VGSKFNIWCTSWSCSLQAQKFLIDTKDMSWILMLKLLQGTSVIITVLCFLCCQFCTTKAFCEWRINSLLNCSHNSFIDCFLKEKDWWLLLINRNFSPNRSNYIWHCVWLNMGKYIFGIYINITLHPLRSTEL
jgi:hypothetical protein